MNARSDPKVAALVAWIDDNEARRAREALREQGRNEVVRALLLGKLQIRDVVTGGWFQIPSPWTDADAERRGVTLEELAELTAPAEGLPPAGDSPIAGLGRLDAIRSLR